VLCPGQGAQAVGMGKAWFDASPEAREVFARADALLGDRLDTKLTELCFAGPVDRLNRTDASQPAIYTSSMACWTGWLAKQGLAPNDIAPSLVAAAGLSLGEYTALAIAGAFSFEDGLELVTLRGRAMQDAANSPAARAGGGGAMLALIGATDEQAATICDQSRDADVLVCANFNAPGQVVLSGHKVACERAVKAAEALGVRSAMLPVAGAFHSPLMAPAAQRLGETAHTTTACREARSSPTSPPAYGDGERSRRTPSVAALRSNSTNPVRWSQSTSGWRRTAGRVPRALPGKTLMVSCAASINSQVTTTTKSPRSPRFICCEVWHRHTP
jgi:[acyl-carrier-protein] S-malonyltransferase